MRETVNFVNFTPKERPRRALPRLIALGAAFVLVLAGSGKGEPLGTGSEGMAAPAPQQGVPLGVAVYERVEPVSGQPVPTFHMSAAEGSLASEKGCLVLKSAGPTLALVFARGTARPRGAGAVRIDDRPFTLGQRVRVGGSSTGGSAVGAVEVPAQCTGFERWYVAPRSVELLVRP